MVAMQPDVIELVEYHPWRRVIFFLLGFGVCAVVAAAWLYPRSPEYMAISQLRITPAGTLTTTPDPGDAAGPRNNLVAFLTEVQVLTSRAVLEDAVTRLKQAGSLSSDLGSDPVSAVQHVLRARPVGQTQVVVLSAEGPEPRFLTRLLTTVAESWRDRATNLYQQQISGEYQDLKRQADDLHNETLAARIRLDEFREADGIPATGIENALAADLQNLSTSYTAALASLAKAQAHLQTLQNAPDAPPIADASQSDAAVAALELKAGALRDQLSDLRRRFTPRYLALDAETKSLPDQIAALDRQIAAQRTADHAAELRMTEEQLQTSQLQFNRLNRDVSAKQKNLENISVRRTEYEALQGDFDRSQKLEQSMVDRVSNLQASQRERAPRLDILQEARFSSAPTKPVPTIYASIGLAGSLAAGILAALLSKVLDGGPAVAWTTPRRRRSDSQRTQINDRARQLHKDDSAPRKLLPAPDPE